MFSFFKKPASRGLVSTAVSAVWMCYEEAEKWEDGVALGSLATIYVQYRAPEFGVPPAILDRFLEAVWAAAIAGRPELHRHFMQFVGAAAFALRATDPTISKTDYLEEFWDEFLCKHSKLMTRSEYEEFGITMLAVIDHSIDHDAKGWRLGE